MLAVLIFFGASRLMALMGFLADLQMVVLTIRIAGYSLVIFPLYRYVRVLDIFVRSGTCIPTINELLPLY